MKQNEKFYMMSVEDSLKTLESKRDGLSSEDVEKRLLEYGKNELTEKASVPTWKIFLESFKDPMVIILIVAAVIQIATGSIMESLIIFLVLILNAIL